MVQTDGNAGIALFPLHSQHHCIGQTAEAALRQTMQCFALAVLTVSVPIHALAQDAADYPNRPIRVIVPVGAGAGIDSAARITAAAAEKYIGQKFIIENKPGGSQRIGSSFVAKSAPD